MTEKIKINLAPRQNALAVVFFVLFSLALVISFNYEPIYSLAVVGGTLVVFIFAQKLELGVYLMALLFPFINLQLFIGQAFNVPYVDLVALAVFIAWVLKSLWVWANTGHFISRRDLPGVGFFLLFIGASLLSLYNSDDVLLSLKYVLRPLAFFYLMFVILPYNVIRTKEVLRKVIGIFWFDGLLISLMGLLSVFLVRQTDLFRIVPIDILGVYPLGTNQNLIAESLVVIIPLVGVLALWQKDVFTKKLLILSMILMGIVTLGTLSRAGWLSILLEISMFVLYHFRKNLRQVVPVVLLGVIASLPLVFYFTQLFYSHISQQANENRLLLTRIAVDAFKRHPMIGSGAGIYTRLVSVNQTFIKLFGNPIDSHGVVQKLLAESGLLGLFTFSLLVLYVLRRVARPLRQVHLNYETRQVVLACLITVVAGLFFQLFNTSYYVSKLWLPVGIALTAVRLVEEKRIT